MGAGGGEGLLRWHQTLQTSCSLLSVSDLPQQHPDSQGPCNEKTKLQVRNFHSFLPGSPSWWQIDILLSVRKARFQKTGHSQLKYYTWRIAQLQTSEIHIYKKILHPVSPVEYSVKLRKPSQDNKMGEKSLGIGNQEIMGKQLTVGKGWIKVSNCGLFYSLPCLIFSMLTGNNSLITIYVSQR